MYRRVLHRIAMFAAIVAVTSGTTTISRAGPILPTPAGLTAGDTFRFVFVTTDGTAASSSNISDYDTFVNSEADGATYNGSVSTWQAIGSTATVNAIDHIGVNPSIAGVYLVDGTQVATGDGTSTGGLWSGSLQAAIDLDIHSTLITSAVWTGTNAAGQGVTNVTLGRFEVVFGLTYDAGAEWVDANLGIPSTEVAVYGVSQVLVVPTLAVPEPSSVVRWDSPVRSGWCWHGPAVATSRGGSVPRGQPTSVNNSPTGNRTAPCASFSLITAETARRAALPASNVGPEAHRVRTSLIKLGHAFHAAIDRPRGHHQPRRRKPAVKSPLEVLYLLGAKPGYNTLGTYFPSRIGPEVCQWPLFARLLRINPSPPNCRRSSDHVWKIWSPRTIPPWTICSRKSSNGC